MGTWVLINGIWYKSSRISFSLKTKDPQIAASRSKELATRLDGYWFHLRMQEDQLLGRFLKKSNTTQPFVEAVVNVGAVVQSLGRKLFVFRHFQQPSVQYR
jgi:hypothetical protein